MFFARAPDLRISDADRDAAADFLKRHYAAGRLTDEELPERIDAVYAARYESQLGALVRDLPELPPARPARRGSLGRAAAVAVIAVAVIAVASILPPEAWVVLAVGLPLLMLLLLAAAPLLLLLLAVVWLARRLDGAANARRTAPRR